MKKLLRSYTNLFQASPEVFTPTSTAELTGLFARAKHENRKITFAAGESSFDSHFLNDDMVIFMTAFDHFDINRDNLTVTAGAGARWGDILSALTPLGLTMPSTVTTSKATVGGTLSGNCLSQLSTFLGKESHHIKRLKLLTVKGDLLDCSADENPEIFKAVIGGFGWLGAVVEAAYALRDIGEQRRIKAVLTKHTGFDTVIDVLEEIRASREWDAAYGTVFLHGDKNEGFIFKEKYTAETDGSPYFYFQPERTLRLLVEALAATPGISRLLSRINFHFTSDNKEYINELKDNLFFMDGNRNFKEFTAKFGIRIKSAQQTYVTPIYTTRDFLNRAASILRERDLIPSVVDTLFILEDDVLLSSNNELQGYANSIAFEGICGQGKVERIGKLFADLNDLCHELGGRTYFVKNVFLNSRAQLQRMYGDNLEAFLNLKQQLDRDFIIRNELFDRIFGNDTGRM